MNEVNETKPVSGEVKQETPLTIDDLKSVLVVIDTSSKRGTWQASELSQIGALHDRINAFVQAAIKVAEEVAAKTNPEPEVVQATVLE